LVNAELRSTGATVFVRDGANWASLILIGDAALAMPEIGVEFSLSEIYQGVEFAPTAD
jgi:hypothetical protein